MTQTGRGQNLIQTVLDFLLAAVFIAMGGTMYQYTAPANGFLGKVCLAVTAACVVLSFFIRKAYKDKQSFIRGIIVTAVICIYLVIFLLINPVNIKAYIMMLCQVLALSIYVFICCGSERIPGALIRYSQLVTVSCCSFADMLGAFLAVQGRSGFGYGRFILGIVIFYSFRA